MNNELKITTFTDLIVWQRGHELVLEVYRATRDFPSEEKFGLTDQLRRSSVSITSNVAEGFSRANTKKKPNFIEFQRDQLQRSKINL